MPPISVNASGTSAALLGGPFSDNDSTGSLDEQALVRVTGKRWWILTIYCCLSWLVGAVWMTFATITEESAIYFGVGESDIQNISALYMLAFVPGAVLMLRFVRHDGIRYCVLACCWFQLGGCVLRSLSAFLAIHVADEPFYFRAAMISGTVLAGVAQPLATSLTARVAAEWFPPGERDIATALGIVTNALGNAGMMGLAPVFISCIKTDAEGVCIAYEGIPLLLLCQLLFTLLILVVALFTFDALPRYPPSISTYRKALAASTSAPPPMWETAKALFRRTEFLKLLAGCCLVIGLFQALLTVLQQLFTPSAFSNDDITLLSLFIFAGGVVGAGVITPMVRDRYKLFLCVQMTACLAIYAVLGLNMQHNDFWVTGMLLAALGFVSLPIIPVAVAGSADVTYPIDEEISTTCVIGGGMVLGALYTVLFGWTLAREDYQQATFRPFNATAIAISGTFAAGLVLCFWFQGKAHRTRAECTSVTL